MAIPGTTEENPSALNKLKLMEKSLFYILKQRRSSDFAHLSDPEHEEAPA
jgi:hypothetical protein